MKNLIQIFSAVLITVFMTSCNGGGQDEADMKLIPVKSGKSYGYIDHAGKYVINPQFKTAMLFYSGVALVKGSDDRFGYIDMEGNYAVKPIYDYATDFSNGLALVAKNDSILEIINTKGETKVILDKSIKEANRFSEGFSRVQIDNKYGFINEEGKLVIPAIYRSAGDFKEGFTFVSDTTDKYGFINKNNELVIKYQFKRASDFSEGLATISNDSKYGYINTDGKIKINPQFDWATEFVGDFAAFKQGELWGFINKKGVIVINPQFKSADLFYNNNLAWVVSSDGKIGYINADGKYTINPQFEHATRFYDDIAFIYVDNKYGIIDKQGKIIVNPQFDEIVASSQSTTLSLPPVIPGFISFLRADVKVLLDTIDLIKFVGDWKSIDDDALLRVYQQGNHILLKGNYLPGVLNNGDKVELSFNGRRNEEMVGYGVNFTLIYYNSITQGGGGMGMPIAYSPRKDYLIIGKPPRNDYENGQWVTSGSARSDGIDGKEFKRTKFNPDSQSSITGESEPNSFDIKSSADTKILTLMSPTIQVGDFYHLLFKDFTTQQEEEYKCDWGLPAIKEILTKCESHEGCPALKGQVYKAKLKFRDELVLDGPEPSGKKEKQWVIVELQKIDKP